MKKISFLTIVLLTVFMVACKTDKKQANEEAGPAESTQVGEEVTYSTDSTTMKGYLAYDKAFEGKRPGILVVHEWWGHNDYTRERARMLAELGYTALAVDMYGDGKQAKHPDDAGKFSGMVMRNIDEAKARFHAALKLLKSQQTVDSTRIAAIGYCFGGSVVLTMANAGEDLDAVAAFHSGVQLPIMPNENIKARILVCNGAADPFVSEESVEAFKRAMDESGAEYEYIAYEGAQHAFTSKDADSLGQKFNLPLAYQEKADKESWKELQELLNETFNK
ncbi:Dienelactone hydrolase [Muriicola jejuensis]|uniref:Prolyl oligopeptidase family serine peptidase n=1 Tax=Muriicola jejuensis TaxID=504488 RepID=A0A6P0UM17_9FLAO|nr:dienelactone hydrolase family protein [Muriicola jejuensis]NER11296.1 prolyl oligopeptidase family serine peptidase [Muriicola jejuensis]SMP21668.1 Dienelactone hydrolase [Muriicola jejuensis]